jgi:two-component system chemotaxis sensor kinase CheA
VVDDSEMHRGIARIVLERAGFDVRLAATAGAAIDDLRRAPVDVAFVDAHMPGMDGFALTEALRADPALAGTIVIGLSTSVEDDRDDARAADMDDLVAKPLCRSTVATVVSRWLAPAAAEDLAGRPAGAAEPSVAA